MTNLNTKEMVRVALATAMICVLSPISLFTNSFIPISLATLVVMLLASVLKEKEATIAVILYLCMGLVGFPVFSAYRSGAAVLFGPTGGYLIGYVFLAYATGISSHGSKKQLLIGMFIGTLILYVFGTVWFIVLNKMPLLTALSYCVFPFLIGDGVKMAAVLAAQNKLSKLFH